MNDNLIYIDPKDWKKIYTLLNEYCLVPEQICSILKCDRKYLQRITNEIPHLFLNSKIKMILSQNIQMINNPPSIITAPDYLFLRNYYYFNKSKFIEWLNSKSIVSCESCILDLSLFLNCELTDEIQTAYNDIKNYQRFAPVFLNVEEKEEWYKKRDESISKANIIFNNSLNDVGKKLYEYFYNQKRRIDEANLYPEGESFSILMDFKSIFNDHLELFTINELSNGRNRQIGYREAYKKGMLKIKLGDKNSKVLFYEPDTSLFKMPILFNIAFLKTIFTPNKLLDLINNNVITNSKKPV